MHGYGNTFHTWTRIIDGKLHSIRGQVLMVDKEPLKIIVLALGANYKIKGQVIKRFSNYNFNFLPDHWQQGI